MGTYSQNVHFWCCEHFFFLPSGCPVNSIFQWQYVFIRFMFLMKHFFLLTIRMAMFTKLFSVVTCCEELSPINHSVYWNINPPPPPPPLRNTIPLFLTKPPPLNWQTVQDPLFRQSPLYIGFSRTPPKIWIF